MCIWMHSRGSKHEISTTFQCRSLWLSARGGPAAHGLCRTCTGKWGWHTGAFAACAAPLGALLLDGLLPLGSEEQLLLRIGGLIEEAQDASDMEEAKFGASKSSPTLGRKSHAGHGRPCASQRVVLFRFVPHDWASGEATARKA